jgi:tetratricopeptide (TPR) repeat protein
LGTTLNNIAIIYDDESDYKLALSNYKESLEIFQILVNMSPNAYGGELCRSLSNLSAFYLQSTPNREISIDYAIKTLAAFFSINERTSDMLESYIRAFSVLQLWELNDEEIKQLIAEKMKEAEEDKS